MRLSDYGRFYTPSSGYRTLWLSWRRTPQKIYNISLFVKLFLECYRKRFWCNSSCSWYCWNIDIACRFTWSLGNHPKGNFSGINLTISGVEADGFTEVTSAKSSFWSTTLPITIFTGHWPLSFDRPLWTSFIFTMKPLFLHKTFEEANFGFYSKTFFRVNA